MIPSYQEELRIRAWKNFFFWCVVFALSVVLYYFFQGYSFDFALKNGIPKNRSEILKPFGIIEVYSSPEPEWFAIDGKSYSNGSKSFYDFGKHEVQIRKKGFIDVDIRFALDTKLPFYVQMIDLVKKPEYTAFPTNVRNILQTKAGFLAETASGVFALSESGKIVEPIWSGSTYIGKTFFRSSSGMLLRYDDDTGMLHQIQKKESYFSAFTHSTGSTTLKCSDSLVLANGDVFCPSDSRLVENADWVSKSDPFVLAATGVFVTRNTLYDLQEGLGHDGYEIPDIGNFRPDDVFRIRDEIWLVKQGFLYEFDDRKEIVSAKMAPFATIETARNFWNDVLIVGRSDSGKSIFKLVQEQKSFFGETNSPVLLDQSCKIKNNYVLTTKEGLFFYTPGNRKMERLLKWKAIGCFGNTIIGKLSDGDKKTFSMLILSKETE